MEHGVVWQRMNMSLFLTSSRYQQSVLRMPWFVSKVPMLRFVGTTPWETYDRTWVTHGHSTTNPTHSDHSEMMKSSMAFSSGPSLDFLAKNIRFFFCESGGLSKHHQPQRLTLFPWWTNFEVNLCLGVHDGRCPDLRNMDGRTTLAAGLATWNWGIYCMIMLHVLQHIIV